MTGKLPKWVDLFLIPFLNLVLAFFVAGLVMVFIGDNPFEALSLLLSGAIWGFSGNGYGYTLFYATGFMFTGL